MESSTIAYRFPEDMTDEMICAKIGCVETYVDLMDVAIPLSRLDVEKIQGNLDGQWAVCSSCYEILPGAR